MLHFWHFQICNSLSLSFLVSIPHCLEIENVAFVFSNLTISNLQFSVPEFSGINSTLCRDRKCCIVFSICGEFGALLNVFRMLLHFSNVPSNGHRVANCRCLSTFCNVSLFVLQEQRSMQHRNGNYVSIGKSATKKVGTWYCLLQNLRKRFRS